MLFKGFRRGKNTEPNPPEPEIRDFLLEYQDRTFFDLREGRDFENYLTLERMGLLYTDEDAVIRYTETGQGIITGRIRTRHGTPGYLR